MADQCPLQLVHPPLEHPAACVCCTIGSTRCASGGRLPGVNLLSRAVASIISSYPAPPSQYSQSPCAPNGNPNAYARKWATRQRKSTGFSGSPFSSSPTAGHILHIVFNSQSVHLVVRVIFFRRTACRNFS